MLILFFLFVCFLKKGVFTKPFQNLYFLINNKIHITDQNSDPTFGIKHLNFREVLLFRKVFFSAISAHSATAGAVFASDSN